MDKLTSTDVSSAKEAARRAKQALSEFDAEYAKYKVSLAVHKWDSKIPLHEFSSKSPLYNMVIAHLRAELMADVAIKQRRAEELYRKWIEQEANRLRIHNK